VGLVERLGWGVEALASTNPHLAPYLHPRAAGELRVAVVQHGEVAFVSVGTFGLLHPDIVESYELLASTVVVDVDVEQLRRCPKPAIRFAPLPRFPSTIRDVAFVVRDGVAAGEVAAAIRRAAGDLAQSVEMFDRFAGGAVAAGHSSVGFRVVYRAPERTLTDGEVDARHAEVVAQIHAQFGATLRG
jgi:phenylalanyl-tRNA synthetase beta chain